MSRWLPLLGVLALVLTPIACGGSDGSSIVGPPPDPGDMDWGGYEPTDEDADFAGESVTGVSLSGEKGQPESDDEIFDDPDYVSAITDPGRVHYMLRIDWGQLVKDTAPEKGLKFSGTLTTTGGAVLVTRTYRFDGNEAVVRPRTAARQVEWDSSTGGHWDGLLFTIITRPEDHYANMRVTIDTVDYTRTFTLPELEAINETNAVGQDDNKVAIHGSKIKRDQYADGLLAGYWAQGELIGQWIMHDGTPEGKFLGHYEPEGNNDGVFFGKLVDVDGKFKGMIKGRYCPLPYTSGPIGWFLGIYTDANLEPAGIVGGHYIEGFAEECGSLRGVWHLDFPRWFDPYKIPSPLDYGGTTPVPQ